MRNLKTLLLMVVLLALDQFTKLAAAAYLKGNEGISLIKGCLKLYYVENRGAAFGIFQGGQIFFYIITAVVMGLLIFFYLKMPGGKKYFPLRLCTVFLMSGAIGNFIDRVWHHFVIDFIYFELIDFPVFNAADIYVTCSAVVLAVLLLFVYKEEELFLKKN